MKDYLKDLRHLKVLLIGVTVLCSLLSILIIKLGLDKAEESREQVFVSDASNTLLVMLAGDIEVNRPMEAKSFIKRFHAYLYQFSPSAKMINANLDKLSRIGDNSVVQYMTKEKESGFYNSLVANSISTELMCDSIQVRESDNPDYRYRFVMYGKTSAISTAKIEYRQLITTGYLKEADRTIEEPNGFRMCLFKEERNQVFRTINRQAPIVEQPRIENDSVTNNQN